LGKVGSERLFAARSTKGRCAEILLKTVDPLPGDMENLDRFSSSRIIAADFDGLSFENRTVFQEITPKICPSTFSTVSALSRRWNHHFQ